MDELQRIVAASLRLWEDQIGDDLAMGKVASWDSLAHMDLIASLEKHYGLTLERDEIVRMTDVATVRQVLRAKGVDL